MNGKGSPRSGEDDGSREAELKIRSWLEGDFLHMDKGLVLQRHARLTNRLASDVNELLAGEAAEKHLDSNWTKPPTHPRQFERMNSIVAKHGDWFSVVAEQERTAPSWAPPQRLFAKSD